MLYLVSWSGGLEGPSFFGTASKTEADTKADEWAYEAATAGDLGDYVQVLTLNEVNASVMSIHALDIANYQTEDEQ